MDSAVSEYKSGGSIPFRFSGQGGEYFKIWIVNIVLSLITLRVFSAWAKVRRKRYFYGCTSLGGSGFEYHADPFKILKGRVIVVVSYFILGLMAQFHPVLAILITLFVVAAAPLIINSALKFNAVNSSYRGVKFGYSSTYKKTFFVFVVLGFLTLITFGILFPYYIYRIKKHIITNSRYGTQKFEFFGHFSKFYLIYVTAILMSAVFMFVVGFFGIFISVLGGIFALFGSLFIYLGSLAVFYFVAAYASVAQTNYVFNSVSIKYNSFRSSMKIMDMMMITATNAVAVVLSLGLFLPWAAVRVVRYKLERLEIGSAGNLDSFIADELENAGSFGEEVGDFFEFDMGV